MTERARIAALRLLEKCRAMALRRHGCRDVSARFVADCSGLVDDVRSAADALDRLGRAS